jgi:hypothetical protein
VPSRPPVSNRAFPPVCALPCLLALLCPIVHFRLSVPFRAFPPSCVHSCISTCLCRSVPSRPPVSNRAFPPVCALPCLPALLCHSVPFSSSVPITAEAQEVITLRIVFQIYSIGAYERVHIHKTY